MENYFFDALHRFVFEEAGGGAIRHLADRGCTARQITDTLSFPIPYEKVREAFTKHLLESGILLREKPGTYEVPEKTEFVREYDKYGKASFRKVAVLKQTSTAGESCGRAEWKEMSFPEFLLLYKERADIVKLPEETELKEAEKNIYISCEFGADRTGEMLSALAKAQQEYIQGILWTKKTMYHLLDRRMFGITVKLRDKELPVGNVYFREGEIPHASKMHCALLRGISL